MTTRTLAERGRLTRRAAAEDEASLIRKRSERRGTERCVKELLLYGRFRLDADVCSLVLQYLEQICHTCHARCIPGAEVGPLRFCSAAGLDHF